MLLKSNEEMLRVMMNYLVLILIALIFVFPIVFMIVSSLKPDMQLLRDSSSLRAFLPVGDISLNNYSAAFDRVPIFRFILNSIFVTAVTLVFCLFLCSMAGFAFVFLDWWGRTIWMSISLRPSSFPSNRLRFLYCYSSITCLGSVSYTHLTLPTKRIV